MEPSPLFDEDWVNFKIRIQVTQLSHRSVSIRDFACLPLVEQMVPY